MSGDVPDDVYRRADDGDGRHSATARPSSRPGATAAMPVLTSAATASRVPGAHRAPALPEADLPATPRRRQLAIVAVALSLVSGLAAGDLVRRQASAAPPSTTVSTVVTTAASADLPWEGAMATVEASRLTATCSAPDAVDGQGDTVSYDAARAVDRLPATAWRCNGDGRGQKLIMTFAPGTELVGVGLINGYAKTEGGKLLYDQYRRITSVRWELPDGSWFVQTLSENDPGLQTLTIPRTEVAGTVRMTIVTSSRPGRVGEVTRDAVLISEVKFFGPSS